MGNGDSILIDLESFMKKTLINVSLALKDEVGNMSKDANPTRVGLVMRFNEDDR